MPPNAASSAGEGRRVRSDGSTFIARVTLTALKDRDGKIIGFAKVTRDFTAERAAEARFQEAIALAATEQRRAEEASHAKSLFVASVSHEVRSPVNSLLGYLQLMRREIAGPLPEPYRAQLARMERIGNHLVGVLDDVLNQSRLESGRFEVRQSPGRLGAVIDSAMSMVEPLAAAKGLTLSNAVAEYGADVTYFGDEHRVRQILVNLLTNGIKFTPAGGRVQISAGLAETPSPEAVLPAQGPWVYVQVRRQRTGDRPGAGGGRLRAVRTCGGEDAARRRVRTGAEHQPAARASDAWRSDASERARTRLPVPSLAAGEGDRRGPERGCHDR